MKLVRTRQPAALTGNDQRIGTPTPIKLPTFNAWHYWQDYLIDGAVYTHDLTTDAWYLHVTPDAQIGNAEVTEIEP